MKSMVAKFSSAMFAACVLSVAGYAETAYWNNDSSATAQWGVPENWTNNTGAALTVAPTNGEDVVISGLPDLPLTPSSTGRYVVDFPVQTIDTGALQGSDSHSVLAENSVNPTIGALSGSNTERYTLLHPASYSTSHHTRDRTFSVADPNAFLGWWTVGDGDSTFELRATSEFVPVMHNVSSAQRFSVSVPTAGTRGRVGSLYDGGAMEKTGAGDLKIDSTTSEKTEIYLKAGSVTLGGWQDGALEALLRKSALRLDASLPETMLTEYDETIGCSSVTNWADAYGRGNYAYDEHYVGTGAYYVPYTRAPFLSETSRSSTGLAYVDFGSTVAAYPAFGPTNCTMRIKTPLYGVRAAFYAVDCPMGFYRTSVLGGTATLDYLSGASASAVLDDSYTKAVVRYGDICVDGKKTVFNKCPLDSGRYTNEFVVSVGTLGNSTVNLLGSSYHYHEGIAYRVGGFRLGEVLLFTNELTRAERSLVNRYLLKKWKGYGTGDDFGTVLLGTSANTVCVDAGEKTSVGEIAAPGGIVKTGDGELAVRRIISTNLSVTVNGGSIAIGGGDTAGSGLAANPLLHLDASVESSLVKTTYEDFPGAVYVTRWADCREGVSYAAVLPSAWTDQVVGRKNEPTFVANAARGLPVIDFGTAGLTADSDTSGMYINEFWNKALPTAYAGFIVMRLKNITKNRNIFGSKNIDMYRDSNGRLLSVYYKKPVVAAALWTINGVPVDAWEQRPELQQNSEFVVVGFSGSEKVKVDAVALSQNFKVVYSGNMQVGEYVLYDRELSDAERIATESYLMERWTGKKHPAASESRIAAMNFASGVGAVVDVGADAAIGTLSGGDGTLVKRGAGAVSVRTMDAAPSSIAVEGGSLAVTEPAFIADATIHLDAMDASSFARFSVVDGVTNVQCWADVRGNGKKATAVHDTWATVDPVLRYVETRPGVVRPTMDFGEYNGRAVYGVNASGDTTNEMSGAAAKMDFGENISASEVFIVFSDAHGAKSASLFGVNISLLRGYSQYVSTGSIFEPYKNEHGLYTTAPFRNNAFVDGVARAATYVLPDGFHTISAWGTAAASLHGIAGVGQYSNSGGWYRAVYNAGGCYISEALLFPRKLSDAERTYLTGYLNHKWFGEAMPVWTNDTPVAAISVAAGASLDLGQQTIDVAALSGAGSFSASGLCGVGSLSVSFDGEGNFVSAPSVTGPVEFDDTVTLNVSVADIHRVSDGYYQVISATSLENLDLSAWTFSAGAIASKRALSLHADGQSVYLRVAKRGLQIIVE